MRPRDLPPGWRLRNRREQPAPQFRRDLAAQHRFLLPLCGACFSSESYTEQGWAWAAEDRAYIADATATIALIMEMASSMLMKANAPMSGIGARSAETSARLAGVRPAWA